MLSASPLFLAQSPGILTILKPKTAKPLNFRFKICNKLNKSWYKNCNFRNRWRKIIIHPLSFYRSNDRSYHEAFRFITQRGDLYHCSQEQRGFPVISLTVVGIYRQNRVKIPLPSKEDLRPSPFLFFLSSENLSVPNKPARNPRVGARAESISFEEFFLAVNNWLEGKRRKGEGRKGRIIKGKRRDEPWEMSLTLPALKYSF